jgi:hypothetical protein
MDDDLFAEDDADDEPRVSRRLWGFSIGAAIVAILVIAVFIGTRSVDTVAHTGCWIHEPPTSISACLGH